MDQFKYRKAFDAIRFPADAKERILSCLFENINATDKEQIKVDKDKSKNNSLSQDHP